MLLQIYYISHIFDWPYNVSGYVSGYRKNGVNIGLILHRLAQNDKLV